ncbi:thiamine-phosphate pyrophosphorylase [Chryseobacterium defluvii]|uniref:Thiamine-phosphate pyrophosphorylase n=1 Tax=Chryseobacterium defluvii TaxID=160396 RepID=A0A840KEF7_9FLAO|nr:thiamine phosphate synthase [Chryseobacterium defluvii]MBB4806378.1 thiamine-phosphate pyrophosphorylase [Chryseobacterium defluvii]
MRTPAIQPGIYLIIDPSMNEDVLFNKLEVIVKENISAIQVWDHFQDEQSVEGFLLKICQIARPFDIPVLINNQWKYLTKMPLHGVHFDEAPENYEDIRKMINRAFITGLTCNNHLSQIRWASENNFDYISFCSLFPSATANSCELVNFETVQQAKTVFKGSVFLAGGIIPGNMPLLEELDYDGIAIVSGIMGSENPAEAIRNYIQQLKK